MSVREKLSRGATGVAVGVVLLAVAGASIAYHFWPSGQRANPYKAFYTDDDGRTYYKDSIFNFPPYQHDGKTAVWAMVFEDDAGHDFVGYCERYTPDVRKELQQKYDEGVRNNTPRAVLDLMNMPSISVGGMEVKMVGEGNPWLPRSRMEHPVVKVPGGGYGYPVMP
ncbi:MAG: hypothetical protein ABSB42_22520 [Tepidisphaeraceae bacterium]